VNGDAVAGDVNRPLIGITMDMEPTRFAMIDTISAALPWAYAQRVRAAGGRAVAIPADPDGAAQVLDAVDGLILSGGSDVEPHRYGEAAHPELGGTNPARDSAELALASQAMRHGVPLLGICRGMQVMAVASGGRLYQHIPDVLGSDRHRIPGPIKQYTEHAVKFETGSRCYDLFEAEAVVNSYHHQAVADPGGLAPTAWCTDDGMIEAVEQPDHPFAVGVQWHPEDMESPALFDALVTAAAQPRMARSALVNV
jgi:putative glutamine amidotransferase